MFLALRVVVESTLPGITHIGMAIVRTGRENSTIYMINTTFFLSFCSFSFSSLSPFTPYSKF